jgi:hypothetical protein
MIDKTGSFGLQDILPTLKWAGNAQFLKLREVFPDPAEFDPDVEFSASRFQA